MRSQDRLNPLAESLLNKRHDYLAPGALEEAVLLAQRGDKRAEALVARTSARLVFKYVARTARGQVERDDLFQEGMLGLLRAIKSFDPNHLKRARFFTYAVFWIKAYIRRAHSRSSIVREPYRALPQERFDSLDSFEVHAPGFDAESDTVTKALVDPGENPEQIAIRREIQRLVRLQALALRQTRKEKEILFGRVLGDAKKQNGKNGLRSIGRRHGVSGEAVRITQKKLESRLRARLKKLAEEVS